MTEWGILLDIPDFGKLWMLQDANFESTEVLRFSDRRRAKKVARQLRLKRGSYTICKVPATNEY